MDWKTMLAYITELLLRNEYLVTENRILRNQIQGRLHLTDGERRTLAEIGKQLGKRALEQVASIVRPETILGSPQARREEVRWLQESRVSRATANRP